jgi:hypothetical protein
MKRIFLSHSSADKNLANELANQLRIELGFSHDAIFVSSEPDDIRSGQDWLDAVLDALNEADIILPLITPSSEKSMWVAFEYGHLWGRKGESHVFPLIHPKAENPSPLNSRQGKKVTDQAELKVFFSDLCRYFQVTPSHQVNFDSIVQEAWKIPSLSHADKQRQQDYKVQLLGTDSLETKKMIINIMIRTDILHDADLTWITENGGLNGVTFVGDNKPANMESTDLGGSSLQRASFWNANLTNAQLGSTKLQGADFHHAVITGASFQRAEMDENTTLPDGTKFERAIGLAQLTNFGAVIDR